MSTFFASFYNSDYIKNEIEKSAEDQVRILAEASPKI